MTRPVTDQLRPDSCVVDHFKPERGPVMCSCHHGRTWYEGAAYGHGPLHACEECSEGRCPAAPPVARKHCAKFTDSILEAADEMLSPLRVPRNALIPPLLYDPFAGTGKGVEFFDGRGFKAFGTELEYEWASQSWLVVHADALKYMRDHPESVDVIFTSPTYGNRMADKDLRESVAGTYAKSLGRVASEGSSCHLQWGPKYRAFHEEAWRYAFGMLRPGGYMLLNIKDHPRNKEVQPVSLWHHETLLALGFECVESRQVECPGNRRGANKDTAIDHEWLFLYRKPE